MKKKKVIGIIVAVAVVGGSAVGGAYAYKSYQAKKLVAQVQPVSDLIWGYWGDSATSYGMVTNDSSQEIYLESSKSVKEVYVEEGDEVAVGDPLMEYDTAELQIDIERKKLEIKNLENDIAVAQHELEKMKNSKPVDKTPPSIDTNKMQELEKQDAERNQISALDKVDNRIYNYITEGALPYGAVTDAEGKIVSPLGTKEDPYIYYCNANAFVYGSFYNSVRFTEGKNDGKYVIFRICKKDAEGKMVTVKKPSATGEMVEEPVVDTTIANHEVIFDGGGIPASYEAGTAWHIFTGKEYVPPTSLADKYMEEFMEHATDWREPEGYTVEELLKLIPEKESRIKELDIQRRQQELQLEKMQKSVSDGIVYAEVSGVVKKVGDPQGYQSSSEPFLVLTGDEGLYVRGTISELLLNDIAVGSVITANSWESGMTFDATITEISDYPIGGNQWGEGNPNVSYYAYTAYIEDSSALRNGEYVDLSISTNQSEKEGLFIEKAYVRQEDGKAYVMIADEKDKLKKQYVVTGRTIYGNAIEIKSGLSKQDRIAFPYGKNAVEGASVEESLNINY
ncbi:MAG: efflux RND transporter periplasmic adaptor subunit [Clostridiales bacterium]|nr:efflux RND transporter periplasmic adaptor subunit [Clostridiales bacterium]